MEMEGHDELKRKPKDKKVNKRKISSSELEGHAEENRRPLLHSRFLLAFTIGHIQMEAKRHFLLRPLIRSCLTGSCLCDLLFSGTLVYFFLLSIWNSIVAVCLTAFLHFAFSSPIFIRMLHYNIVK